eukprot:c4589_g1_i1 orf=1-282(-)
MDAHSISSVGNDPFQGSHQIWDVASDLPPLRDFPTHLTGSLISIHFFHVYLNTRDPSSFKFYPLSILDLKSTCHHSRVLIFAWSTHLLVMMAHS